jgi:hypothetical protein
LLYSFTSYSYIEITHYYLILNALVSVRDADFAISFIIPG